MDYSAVNPPCVKQENSNVSARVVVRKTCSHSEPWAAWLAGNLSDLHWAWAILSRSTQFEKCSFRIWYRNSLMGMWTHAYAIPPPSPSAPSGQLFLILKIKLEFEKEVKAGVKLEQGPEMKRCVGYPQALNALLASWFLGFEGFSVHFCNEDQKLSSLFTKKEEEPNSLPDLFQFLGGVTLLSSLFYYRLISLEGSHNHQL